MAYEVRNPRWSNSEGTSVDVEIKHPKLGWIQFTAMASDTSGIGSDIFKAAQSGAYGLILEMARAPFSKSAIVSAFNRRISEALSGKSESLQREAIYLQNLALSGVVLSSEQKDTVVMFQKINKWETAMIDVRQKLIEDKDTSAYKEDATWPEKPSGLPIFLEDF